MGRLDIWDWKKLGHKSINIYATYLWYSVYTCIFGWGEVHKYTCYFDNQTTQKRSREVVVGLGWSQSSGKTSLCRETAFELGLVSDLKTIV